MSNNPLLATLPPDDYAARFMLVRDSHAQQQIAAQIDPGYIINDTPNEWAVGMVLGWAEDTTPETPVRRSIWRARNLLAQVTQRITDAIDPTVRYL